MPPVVDLVDATGWRHRLEGPPRRVISLVPSTTETVFVIGGDDRLEGITRFCVHPKRARDLLPVIGGTKSPNLELILSLGPDLVLANQEENRREDVLALRENVPVFVFYPRDVPAAIRDVRNLGRLLGRDRAAEELASEIERRRPTLRAEPFRYIYLIWKRPYMAVGRDTFVDALLSEAGGVNAAPSRGRYPEMTIEELESSSADVILLSTEPFPFTEEHGTELLSQFQDPDRFRDRILVVDGQLLSWHGARLVEGLPYAAKLAASISELITSGGQAPKNR
ncbi:MAG TPA: helical backbone metal receptor [Vicinamibacteria bacterium]|nr:helical backbone metal receptor [Vicinamibacteria bacterium]